ncbi:hypothetical protein SPLC1_S010940 [Arthrospira platensis C1]|nr:hypothetical protein SPLC1_S010940 [Arthrospira platensis C1]
MAWYFGPPWSPQLMGYHSQLPEPGTPETKATATL